MRDDIHIVLDSISDVQDTDLMNNPRIHVLRLIARHGDEEWFDGDKSTADLFKLVEKTGKLPQTSQPPVGMIAELYTELVKAGKKVIVINCSSGLSGTYQTCSVVAKQVMAENPGSDIRVFDGRTCGCSLCANAVHVLKKIDEENIDMDEAEAYLNDLITRTKSFMILDTLEYLAKGGRIGGAKALLGSIFGIRPILKITPEGTVAQYDKCRTRKKGLKRIAEIALEQGEIEELFLPNALVPEDAQFVADIVKAKYPDIPIWITNIGTPLAAHLGPGVMGVCVRVKA